MSEKYKARTNDQINEIEDDNKSEQEKKEDSTAKALSTGVDIGLDVYTGGAYSKVKDKISKVPVVGKMANNAWDQKINSVSKKLAKTPIGNVAQKLDDSGLTDTLKGGYDAIFGAKNGDMDKAQKGVAELSGNSEKTKSILNNKKTKKSSFDNIMPAFLSKKMKIKIAIVAGVFLLFVCFIFALTSTKDYQNMELTNNSTMKSKSSGSKICKSNSSINGTSNGNGKMIYVGDSRTVGMKEAVNNESITFIAESSMGYSWLMSTALPQLESKLTEDANQTVILALGVNDLYNIDNYIKAYNDLISKYTSTNFFVMSVNPVDDAKAAATGDPARNSDIEVFNQKLQGAFFDKYIDSYNGLSSRFNTTDGVHYDNATYIALNDYVSSTSGGGTSCSASSGDLSSDLETVGKWYIENVPTYYTDNGYRTYYQSPFATRGFGDDCTEFAALFMSYVSGVDITESYSGEMVYPDGDWAKGVAEHGWKAYTSDQIGSVENLQAGDVMIAQQGALYCTEGEHAEIYIDSQSTFGWGSRKYVYPTPKTITASESGGHIHFKDGGHDYITIYRYEG